jgi:hypothetical protein
MSDGLGVPGNGGSENALQQLTKVVKHLEQRFFGNNKNNQSAGGRKCFCCGSSDHLFRDCTADSNNNNGGGGSNDPDKTLPKHKDNNNGSDRPKKGESHEKVLPDGKKIWCGRCNRNRGTWTKGPTAHATTDHIKGWRPTQPTEPLDNDMSSKDLGGW